MICDKYDKCTKTDCGMCLECTTDRCKVCDFYDNCRFSPVDDSEEEE